MTRGEGLPCTKTSEKICHMLQLLDLGIAISVTNSPMGMSSLLTLQSNVVIYKVHIRERNGVATNNFIGFKYSYSVVDSIRTYSGVWVAHTPQVRRASTVVFVAFPSGT